MELKNSSILDTVNNQGPYRKYWVDSPKACTTSHHRSCDKPCTYFMSQYVFPQLCQDSQHCSSSFGLRTMRKYLLPETRKTLIQEYPYLLSMDSMHVENQNLLVWNRGHVYLSLFLKSELQVEMFQNQDTQEA